MNEIEQAIEQFKIWENSGWSKSETPNSHCLTLAIQALEKQIPKQGKIDRLGLVCPICNSDLNDDDIDFGYRPNYCLKCGQKLSWEVSK